MHNLSTTKLNYSWNNDSRWHGIKRPYTAEDVEHSHGSIHIEHTLARRGAEKLWRLLHEEPYVATLGALTGNQALQQVKAGLKAIYLSGWQVAADANLAGQMYLDQSLYPANSVPQASSRTLYQPRHSNVLTKSLILRGKTISIGSPLLSPMAKPVSAVP